MTSIARTLFACATTLLAAPLPLLMACSSSTDTPTATGGVATGGMKATGGVVATGGVTSTGGVVSTGGTVATGGSSTGGVATGGVSTGGSATGGTAGASGSSGAGGQGAGSGGMAGASAGGGGAGGMSGAGGAAGGNAGAGGGGAGGGGTGGAGAGGGGAAGGGTGGAGGASGGGAGGAGGTTCGTLGKATDGSYVRTGWTGEYTCTGTCPAKNQADMGDVATRAFDGNYQTRWSTGVYQSALKQQNKFPLFFTVDMKQAVPVSKLTTHPGCQDIFDSPGTIEVLVSTDGTNFTSVTPTPHTPVEPPNEACPPNMNSKAIDTITFPTTCARYIRLKGTQRTTSDRYWAIGEMEVFP